MTLHETGEDQPGSRDADLDDAAKTELQRSSVTFQVFTKYGIGGMKKDRNAKLFDSSVEGREPFSVDARIAADASGNVHAHEAKLMDRMVQNLDGDFCVCQRNSRAGPNSARIFPLRPRHLLVPHDCRVTALLRRQI